MDLFSKLERKERLGWLMQTAGKGTEITLESVLGNLL